LSHESGLKRKSIEIDKISARRGLNPGNDPLRATLNWSALNELDVTDPAIRLHVQTGGMYDERMTLQIM